jgi:hypothetical protein
MPSLGCQAVVSSGRPLVRIRSCSLGPDLRCCMRCCQMLDGQRYDVEHNLLQHATSTLTNIGFGSTPPELGGVHAPHMLVFCKYDARTYNKGEPCPTIRCALRVRSKHCSTSVEAAADILRQSPSLNGPYRRARDYNFVNIQGLLGLHALNRPLIRAVVASSGADASNHRSEGASRNER